VIRGMDSNRVRLLEDGTSISDVSDIGPDHGTPIDPLAARSIEVVAARPPCAMAARRLAA
jgi:iron complex outermembrane receptor protein